MGYSKRKLHRNIMYIFNFKETGILKAKKINNYVLTAEKSPFLLVFNFFYFSFITVKYFDKKVQK